jgi:alpha,alpha-trehalase
VYKRRLDARAALTWFSTALITLCSFCVQPQAQALPRQSAHSSNLQAILNYISSAWDTLTRSTTSCVAVADTKVDQPSILYLPTDSAIPAALNGLSAKCGIHAEHLPSLINGPGQVKVGIQPPGLLFLPNPYVVPGGRFNEMYGWDSYFIIRGLLRQGKIDLARGMIENFFFEIEHYGAVLNANRTYYLTRSQPPFLSSMIIAVYEADKARHQEHRTWLAKAYEYASRDYQMWISEPHRAGTTGLSRYYDYGEGPVPEGLRDEVGYYQDVLGYFFGQNKHSPYLVETDSKDALPYPQFSLQTCGDKISSPANCKKYVGLSAEYYKGDRAMRESGFDVSFRFEPYGADTHHYAPVCLNSLLYKTETDLEKMSIWLGDKQSAAQWRLRAEKRKDTIRSLLWNQQRGMFFDYQFEEKRQSSYEYATTFYPLWAGLATTEQARAVVRNLRVFEHQGGLAMSTNDTGVQWDYPYGWAPIQLLAVEGLRRYGYAEDANRVSYEFLSMVLANFQRDGNIREKYNVVTDSSNIEVAEGYRSNVIGFGWTNGVFLELLHQLPQQWVSRLAVSNSE